MADEKGYPPVQLPAGSIDAQELQKELEKAHSVKNVEQHPERINKAIVASASDLTKKVLANADKPAVPFGAETVEQETVYAEGGEPVKTHGIAFKPAKDAKTGAEAAKMRYEETDRGEVVATDEPPTAVVDADEPEAPATLGELAADATDGKTGKDK